MHSNCALPLLEESASMILLENLSIDTYRYGNLGYKTMAVGLWSFKIKYPKLITFLSKYQLLAQRKF